MFKFTGRFHNFKIDVKRWSAACDEKMMELLKEAMREYLTAAILKVPVFTGMARGSLRPIGRFVNMEIPISPDPRASEYPEKTIWKGEERGQNFSFVMNNGRVIVHWSTEVEHFITNEFNNMEGKFPLRHPTPWESRVAGREAYRTFLREELQKRVPEVLKFVVRTEIKGNGIDED